MPEVQPGEKPAPGKGSGLRTRVSGGSSSGDGDAGAPDVGRGDPPYLGSGLVKGIGPVTARRIVDHFGPDTLERARSRPAG